jgi:predicted ATPase
MSEATWQLMQDEVQIEPKGAIAVEDRSASVPVYAFCRMTRWRSGVSGCGERARSPFIGRVREMAILQERLAQMRQQLQEVGLDPEEAAPYLLHLLGIAAGTERVSALSPEEHKARTFACLRQFSLQHSRRQPLILAVENPHWIDATSEAYLTSLVERLAGAPILLLTTYQPGYRLPWLEKSCATQLALPGLTARDSLVVVQSVRQTTPLADALQQEIVEKAAGNPFFLEELTWAVVADGDHPATLVVPDTV